MKLVNPPLGNMSGSLGGLTFRTQKGQTVVSAKKLGRPIKSPFDLVTSRIQIEVSNDWSGISVSDKSQWELFAGTIFKPRHHTNSGTASGFNAFFSLNATAQKLQTVQIESQLSSADVVLNTDPTNNTYQKITTPPVNALTQTIATTAETDNIQVELASVERVEDMVNFTLNITTTTSSAYELETPLQDSNGNPIAFTFYASPAKKYSSQKSNKKFNSILFSTSPKLVSTSPIVESSIVLSVSIDDLQNCVPAQYNLDKFIDIGFCVNSLSGAVQYVNNLTVQVRDIFGEYDPPPSPHILAYPAYVSPYLIMYDTDKEEIIEKDFGLDASLNGACINEKYIVAWGNVQTQNNSAIFVYDRVNDQILNYFENLTVTVIGCWLDDEVLYVRANFTGETYNYCARFSLKTGNHMSCPSIDLQNIKAIMFDETTAYLIGSANLYYSNSIYKIDKLTGNSDLTAITTNLSWFVGAIDTTRKLMIVYQSYSSNSYLKIFNYETGTELFSQQMTTKEWFYGTIVNDYFYIPTSYADGVYGTFYKINLDTFVKSKGASLLTLTKQWTANSQGKLYSRGFLKLIDNSYLTKIDTDTGIQSAVTGFETQNGQFIAGIP